MHLDKFPYTCSICMHALRICPCIAGCDEGYEYRSVPQIPPPSPIATLALVQSAGGNYMQDATFSLTITLSLSVPHPCHWVKCQTCSNQIRSSVTFQSSFFKRLVSLYFWVKSACSFALHFMLLMQNYLTWLLCSPLATAYFSIRNRQSKTATCKYICTVCMHEKEPQEPQITLQSM